MIYLIFCLGVLFGIVLSAVFIIAPSCIGTLLVWEKDDEKKYRFIIERDLDEMGKKRIVFLRVLEKQDDKNDEKIEEKVKN